MEGTERCQQQRRRRVMRAAPKVALVGPAEARAAKAVRALARALVRALVLERGLVEALVELGMARPPTSLSGKPGPTRPTKRFASGSGTRTSRTSRPSRARPTGTKG